MILSLEPRLDLGFVGGSFLFWFKGYMIGCVFKFSAVLWNLGLSIAILSRDLGK